MMKKLLAIIFINLILIMMLFTFSGCGSNVNKEENVNNTNESNQSDGEETLADDDNQLYFKVLENEIKYVNEDNNETLFKTYMENYKENSDSVKIKYTICDFDNDSKNEMIVMIEAFSDGFYLILNNENGIVYGFEDVYRGMKDIKTDGTYSASSGATTNGIYRSKFEKNKRTQEALAEMDMGNCKIAEKDVLESEYLKYFEEFSKKENVTFTTYTDHYNFNTDDSNKTSSTEIQSSFKEGVYKMTKPSLVGTEAEGFDTTITLENGKASFLESYWGIKKFGTYSVQDDTLIINYTSGNEVDSIEGDTGIVALNEVETYKVEGTKLTLQKTSADAYYTAGSNVYELNK